MDDIDNWLKILLAIFALVGILAFVLAYYKAKVTEAQLVALRGDRDDLNERVNRLEGDKTRLENENNTLISRVAVLESLVSPNEAINKLIIALQEHDSNVATRYNRNDKNITLILEHLDKILDAHELGVKKA